MKAGRDGSAPVPPGKRQPWIVQFLLWGARVVVFFVLAGTALTIYEFLFKNMFGDRRYLTGFLALWLFTAYLVLPRIHRWLTRLYVPDYFIGRVRTGDGLLGDPVNLAVNGSREQLIAAMLAAGWVEADDLGLRSTIQMVRCTLFGRSYPSAPVSSLYLFSRRQDLAFEQEVGGKTHRRHHVRFWRTPEGWWLPGGHRADWVAAATFDRSVGFSLFTGQFTHRIAEDTDEERDYVVETLRAAGQTAEVRVVKHFASGYRSRNGGGDSIRTDGALPFVTLG